MAGEPILIVDDTPVNLKLTRILLVNEGYKVLTAASAEEALELLRSYHPKLILADIQLPGIDGLEFTRRIKNDEATRDIIVVALTAFAMKGDEQRAVDAGCDGYITKPIDTRDLGARIRVYLDRDNSLATAPAAPVSVRGIPAAELYSLRRRFLEEGLTATRKWLLDLDTSFDAKQASHQAHQWIGAAGLLGYDAIVRLSREVESVLRDRPVDSGQLRESLTSLVLAFSTPREARDEELPESIVQALAGKRVALVGLPANERQRLCVALQRAKAIPVFLDLSDSPHGDAVPACDLIVIHVDPQSRDSAWLDPAAPPGGGEKPIVFVGDRDDLLLLAPAAQALAREYLMDAWEFEEALVRLALAFSQPNAAPPSQLSGRAARLRILVADDDPTVLALVAAAIRNSGMECHTAANGRSAIEAIRRLSPHAAVLDVNMPAVTGFNVLSCVRSEKLPVRVVLLTARQQESDILHGFSLGADDYVVKPFSPLELVARLRRLLQR